MAGTTKSDERLVDDMTYQIESEFMELRRLVEAIQPASILEIGSLTGETLSHWIDLAKVSVVSIDLLVHDTDPRYLIQKAGHDHDWAKLARDKGVRFSIFQTHSTAQDLPAAVAKQTGWLDFLFIDGGHDFRTCASDYLNYGWMVRRGGLIAFHDIASKEWPDVRVVWDMVRAWHPYQREIGNQMGIGVVQV